MRKTMNFLLFFFSALALFSCGNNNENKESSEVKENQSVVATVETVTDSVVAYSEMQVKENCFIVISKQELKLYVCVVIENDTVRLVEYPVCMGKNLGHKQKKGDMRTPECAWDNPFIITEIVDASDWSHDFGDGRGSILAYGNWFMRLKTPGFSGIGIHGSTNNESSVPGRASEGCIRLRNADLDVLKEQYAYKNMRVVIKGEEEGLKPFEQKYY